MAEQSAQRSRLNGTRLKPPSARLTAFKDLLRTVRRWHMSTRTLVAVVLIGMASGGASIGLVALTSMIVNGKLQPNTTMLVAFAGSCFLVAISRFASEALLMRVINRAGAEIRLQLSERVLMAPLGLLEEIGNHRVLLFLTEDVSTIVNALGQVPYQCINLIVLLGGLCYLGSLSFAGLAVVLTFMALGTLAYRFGSIAAMKRIVQARQIEEEFFEHLTALTSGTKELKLHTPRRQAFVKQVLRKTAESYCDAIVDGLTRFRIISSLSESLIFVLLCLLLFSPALGAAIKHADLVSFVIAITFMMSPLTGILHTIPLVGHASAAVRKIEAFEQQLPEVGSFDSARAAEITFPMGILEFIDVSHKYRHEIDGSEFSLGPLSLSFTPGELIFITGGNGSGKTTFAKLLVGLYSPEAGCLRLGGIQIGASNIECYRNCFSAIFSDFYLFEQLLGITGQDLDERAAYYIRELQLSHKVTVQDGRFSTTQLSHGQRKRLALVAAYMEDRPFCLFDEWAADQDPGFKDVFYLHLLPGMKAAGKTVFVITHDERYYPTADRVIKLEEGVVVSDIVTREPAIHVVT
jgi:putative ATP-binding cassette transporter